MTVNCISGVCIFVCMCVFLYGSLFLMILACTCVLVYICACERVWYFCSRQTPELPVSSPPYPFVCPLPPLVIYFPHLFPSHTVPFVTTVVTCGCLCPTMHCNPPAPLDGGGTAVTSTEKGEVRWGEERVMENEGKKRGKKTRYSIGNKGFVGGRGMQEPSHTPAQFFNISKNEPIFCSVSFPALQCFFFLWV